MRCNNQRPDIVLGLRVELFVEAGFACYDVKQLLQFQFEDRLRAVENLHSLICHPMSWILVLLARRLVVRLVFFESMHQYPGSFAYVRVGRLTST